MQLPLSNKSMRWGTLFIFGLVISSVGCGKNTTSINQPSTEVSTEDFNMCSKLDFSTVSWSTPMKLNEQKAFMLALNISGSYEGNSAWSNLATDFDGQGISLGLLNQNLGQGTLQPLIIKMRDNHLDVLKKIFSKSHLNSLLGMLSTWEDSTNLTSNEESEIIMSTLDLFPFLTDENAKSVDWAKANIYNGEKIKSDWFKEFTTMAESPEYISIQVAEAHSLHKKSIGYVAKMNVPEVRAYLLAFDFVNQNGGLYNEDIAEYIKYTQSNLFASSTDKLTKMLELRLRHVTRQFVEDVRSRKNTIIHGKGKVHGANRNLENEYCYNRFFAILVDPNRLFQFLRASFLVSQN